MLRWILSGALVVSLCLAACTTTSETESEPNDGWVSLFDGESLDGWKASENKDSWSVRNGMLVADGPRSHLFYVGPVNGANFKNFELKVDVMTTPGSNAGIYFHTEYQEEGWPSKGYEVQVNVSHKDPRKTGSLYAVQDVADPGVEDNRWYTQHIIVQGDRVISKVNGRTLVNYVQPAEPTRGKNMSERVLSSGTFALQAHDPNSVVYFKNLMVRPLPD